MPDTNDVLQQGRYRIVNQTGQNGTGILYEAYDNVQSTNVVLKELPIKLNKVTTPAQLESLKLAFAGEAKILAEIKHDAFIQVSDYFSEIDRHFLVFEAAEGDYLSEMLEKSKMAFSLTEVTAWADQLLEALNYLHTQSPVVIHRDVRPQNIKLTLAGQIKLLALSIAKNSDAKASAISNPGFDAATLHYLPLEQIWGKLDLASQKVIANSYSEGSVDILMQPPDVRSDIYSLGATLYHLLTARRPVDALERSIDILEGKADPLPIPSKLNPGVPPEISYVLMKAMEIKRENRFDSVIMMRQVLRTAVVRVKEREAKEGKKTVEAPTHAVSLSQDHSAEEHHGVKHSSVETEADLNRQMELIKIRLREAEAQRLKAEQRAAEAEKRLLEKETHDVTAYSAHPSSAAVAEDLQVLDIPSIAHEPAATDAKQEDSAPLLDIPKTHHRPAKPAPVAAAKEAAAAAASTATADFAFSYSDESKEKKGSWKVMAAAACLVVFGGAGFGIWSLMSSKTSDSAQPPAMSLSDTAKPANSAETAPSQNPENTPAADQPVQAVQTDQAAQTPGPAETTPQQPAGLDVRPASPTAAQIAAQKEKDKAKKQPVQTAKAPTPQKKAVTVDDLLN